MNNVSTKMLVAAVILGGFGFGIRSTMIEIDRRERLDHRMAVLEDFIDTQESALILDSMMLRQAAWEAQHPCGTGTVIPGSFYALNDFPQEFPEKDSKWCQARVKEQEKQEAKQLAENRRMPWGEMFGCVYAYSGLLLQIDTVKDPRIHDSWVLGGGCEDLANKLVEQEFDKEVWNSELYSPFDPEMKGLCHDFANNSPTAALKCQKEMQRWLEVFCLNTTESRGIRECRQRQLATALEYGDDDERFYR